MLNSCPRGYNLPSRPPAAQHEIPSMTPPPKSRVLKRTRSDHATEMAEDYVEAIAETIAERGTCRVTDLARLFGVSHVTVTKTANRLKAEGLIDTEPYGPLRLTDRGRKLATASRERHAIVLQFLIALGISPAVAEVDSEGIEHHVSHETLRAFRRFIDQQAE